MKCHQGLGFCPITNKCVPYFSVIWNVVVFCEMSSCFLKCHCVFWNAVVFWPSGHCSMHSYQEISGVFWFHTMTHLNCFDWTIQNLEQQSMLLTPPQAHQGLPITSRCMDAKHQGDERGKENKVDALIWHNRKWAAQSLCGCICY